MPSLAWNVIGHSGYDGGSVPQQLASNSLKIVQGLIGSHNVQETLGEPPGFSQRRSRSGFSGPPSSSLSVLKRELVISFSPGRSTAAYVRFPAGSSGPKVTPKVPRLTMPIAISSPFLECGHVCD